MPEQLSRSSEEGDGIVDIVIEDNEEFILALVLIIEPVIDLDIIDPIPFIDPLRLSRRTLFGRTNFPRFGPQVKYLTPFTDPSFLPIIIQTIYFRHKVLHYVSSDKKNYNLDETDIKHIVKL